MYCMCENCADSIVDIVHSNRIIVRFIFLLILELGWKIKQFDEIVSKIYES